MVVPSAWGLARLFRVGKSDLPTVDALLPLSRSACTSPSTRRRRKNETASIRVLGAGWLRTVVATEGTLHSVDKNDRVYLEIFACTL